MKTGGNVERAATVTKRVREWLDRVETFTGRDIVDDSALLDEVDETLSSDENVRILAGRFGYPTPDEMGPRSEELALGEEVEFLRESLEDCESRKPKVAGVIAPAKKGASCKTTETPTGPRKGCVVEDRRAWRWIGVGGHAPKTGANPAKVQVIAALRYSCNGPIDGGLCPTGRYDGYVHEWERNPPVFVEATNEILGPVAWVGAIDDWPGGPAPSPGAPARRIGKLDWIRFAGGRMLKFENAGLWRDSAGTALFILGENPATNFHGIPLIGTARLEKERQSKDVTAILFVGSECESCAKLKDELVRLARRFPRAFAFDVDLPGQVDPAIKAGATGTPSVVLYRDGKTIGKITRIKAVLEKLESCEASILRGSSRIRAEPQVA